MSHRLAESCHTPPSERVTFWIGTGIVHGSHQKTVLYGTAYGDSISTVHNSASSILKRRETHVS